jgi:hypothetical protein
MHHPLGKAVVARRTPDGITRLLHQQGFIPHDGVEPAQALA